MCELDVGRDEGGFLSQARLPGGREGERRTFEWVGGWRRHVLRQALRNWLEIRYASAIGLQLQGFTTSQPISSIPLQPVTTCIIPEDEPNRTEADIDPEVLVPFTHTTVFIRI